MKCVNRVTGAVQDCIQVKDAKEPQAMFNAAMFVAKLVEGGVPVAGMIAENEKTGEIKPALAVGSTMYIIYSGCWIVEAEGVNAFRVMHNGEFHAIYTVHP